MADSKNVKHYSQTIKAISYSKPKTNEKKTLAKLYAWISQQGENTLFKLCLKDKNWNL